MEKEKLLETVRNSGIGGTGRTVWKNWRLCRRPCTNRNRRVQF